MKFGKNLYITFSHVYFRIPRVVSGNIYNNWGIDSYGGFPLKLLSLSLYFPTTRCLELGVVILNFELIMIFKKSKRKK